MSRKVEAAIQAQIDKMRKEYMTHAQYVNELLERNERLKQVNDEQAAVLTACQDENDKLHSRIQAQEKQKKELYHQVQQLWDRNLELQEDNERMGKALVKYLGEQDG